MSTAVLTQTSSWKEHASARIEQFAANQGAVSANSQAVLKLVSSYDSVTFDFSDWTAEQLNEKTTSFYWGLEPGSLDISCYNLRDAGAGGSQLQLLGDMRAASLATEGNDAESSKDIVCIHDWCVEQARAANSAYVPGQRIFRFGRGTYAGPLPFPGLRVGGS
ncbi:hypothetical protein F5X96DRAFT_490041 [Biscogniauxia mediterranea]|nr:hypothetical protein F5X96DRAFT_490041 [Biscogniauxia mediterranea]